MRTLSIAALLGVIGFSAWTWLDFSESDAIESALQFARDNRDSLVTIERALRDYTGDPIEITPDRVFDATGRGMTVAEYVVAFDAARDSEVDGGRKDSLSALEVTDLATVVRQLRALSLVVESEDGGTTAYVLLQGARGFAGALHLLYYRPPSHPMYSDSGLRMEIEARESWRRPPPFRIDEHWTYVWR